MPSTSSYSKTVNLLHIAVAAFAPRGIIHALIGIKAYDARSQKSSVTSVMGRHDDDTPPLMRADDARGPRARRIIQAGERLIKKKRVMRREERTRQSNTATLPT